MKSPLPYSLRRSALTLLALCAIFFQATVVQAHVHFPSLAHEVQVCEDGGGQPFEHAAVAAHSVCAACHGLALGRGLDRVSGPALQAPTGDALPAGTVIERAERATLSHHWNSRAPPARL